MTRFFYFISALIFSCALFTAGYGQTLGGAVPPLLNELDVNPGGTDNPCEYVELKGTPGAAVENIHFVSIEGDIGSTPGVATAVITFGVPGPVLGSNGLLVVTGTQTCGSRTFPAGTTVAPVALLDTASGALQNGTNSFLLISSTTPITAGTDYDTDNNGTLESLPAGATVIDGVSWSDGGAGDITYGSVVLNATGGTIGACTRFPGNTTPNSAAAWYAGAMTGTNDANTYSATIRTANFPGDGALTPGAPNVGTPVVPGRVPLDFNGDGKTDFAITRDSAGQRTWYVLFNGTTNFGAPLWGIDTDRNVPSDYDGDGKTDVAIWREGPQSTFYILRSSDGTVQIDNFGQTGDRPGVVRDYDGDGKADVAVYREGASAGAQSFFYYRGSLNNPGGNITFIPWGTNGDVPTSGDFDGDGKGDFAIRRNVSGNGVFYIAKSGGGTDIVYFGLSTDAIVPGDYDGDGKTDLTAARPVGSVGNFYWLNSSNGTITGPVVGANPTTDSLVCGDYDGDGKTDIAVWRSTDGTFYVRSTASGNWSYQPWGIASDRAVGEWNVTGGN
jgi:hypothetical protein